MSLSSEAADFKTRITSATKRPCYDHDEAQKLGAALPPDHSIIYVAHRFGGNERGGTRDTDLRRLSVRIVSKTVDNARRQEDAIFALFAHSGVNYEAGGGAYEYESGFYSDLIDFTYSI